MSHVMCLDIDLKENGTLQNGTEWANQGRKQNDETNWKEADLSQDDQGGVKKRRDGCIYMVD